VFVIGMWTYNQEGCEILLYDGFGGEIEALRAKLCVSSCKFLSRITLSEFNSYIITRKKDRRSIYVYYCVGSYNGPPAIRRLDKCVHRAINDKRK